MFSKQSYFEQFAKQGSLVSSRFIRSLSVESDGTELSEAMAATVGGAPSEFDTQGVFDRHTMSSPQPPLSDSVLTAAVRSWSRGLSSCLEPYVSPEWVMIGAAMGVGCAIGVALGSGTSVFERLRRLRLPRGGVRE